MVAPYYVSPPPAPPKAAGLFDAAIMMPFPVQAAGGNGIIFQPDACNSPIQIASVECPPVTGTKTFYSPDAAVSGSPFAVIASYECNPVGIDLEEAYRRVTLRLDLREQHAVEERVWAGSTGVLGTVPSLFGGATVLGPASCPIEAMELLEQWLADNRVLGGLIHTRPGMIPHLADKWQFREPSGRLLKTHMGTEIVAGLGYSGVGPTGQPTTGDTEWMYASGRILVWRGDVQTPPLRQTVDLSTNTAYALAERLYVVAIECGVAAVEVTRTCST